MNLVIENGLGLTGIRGKTITIMLAFTGTPASRPALPLQVFSLAFAPANAPRDGVALPLRPFQRLADQSKFGRITSVLWTWSQTVAACPATGSA